MFVSVSFQASNSGNRKPSEYEVLTLEQVSNMTDNLLVKLFSDFESNEMWRRFTYTCRMLPAACSQFFQSFGSEHKARAGMKAHLLSHLKSLLDVHTSKLTFFYFGKKGGGSYCTFFSLLLLTFQNCIAWSFIKSWFSCAMDSVLAFSAYELVIGEGFLFSFFYFSFWWFTYFFNIYIFIEVKFKFLFLSTI